MTLFDMDLLWRNAIAAVPLAILVAALCRWAPLRPSTRHAMWAGVLLVLLAPPIPALTTGLQSLSVEPEAAVKQPSDSAQPASTAPTGTTLPTPVDKKTETARPESQYRVTHEATSAGATRSAARVIAPAESLVMTRIPSRPPTRSQSNATRIASSAQQAVTGGKTTPDRGAHHRDRGDRSRLTAQAADSDSPRTEQAAAIVQPTPTTEVDAAADEPHAATTAFDTITAFASVTTNLTVDATRRWFGALKASALEFRTAVTSLPPIPAAIWIGGSLAVLILSLTRVLIFRRVLRHASPADAQTVATVRSAASAIGLTRTPQISMVTGRVSPMIWCGLRPRLVLPAELWEELDEVGRSAVVSHELAHLRRRDHWIHWAQALIGVVYWWHPVAWWARRRLREEADHCCDAWVTTLLPTGRRSYAQALLATQRYLNHPTQARPAGALAIAGGRARPFARRLTMVMTQRTKPRNSITGFMLAAAIAGAGVFAAPLWACPKEEKPKKVEARAKVHVAPKALKAPMAPKAPAAPKAHAAPHAAPAPHADGLTTFEQHMRQRVEAPDDVERRIERLERRLERLSEQLEKLLNKSGGASGAFFTPQSPAGLPGLRALGDSNGLTAPAPIGFAGGAEIVRTYELPVGKLDDLTTLMSRSDVPVLIRPMDGAIEVRATEPQHMVFRAFVDMIDGEDEEVEYLLPQGKLRDLTELMSRSDVPILIVPGDHAITVRGTTLEQRIFSAFVDLLDGGFADARPSASLASPAYAESVLARARHAEYASAARARINSQIAALASHTASLEGQANMFQEQAAQFEKEAEAMERKADSLRDEADKLLDKADALREKAEKKSGAAREEYLRRAQDLTREAEALNATAESFEAQCEGLAAQAEQHEQHAEAFEEQIEEIESQLDDLDDQMADLEDLENDLEYGDDHDEDQHAG